MTATQAAFVVQSRQSSLDKWTMRSGRFGTAGEATAAMNTMPRNPGEQFRVRVVTVKTK